MEYLSIFLPQWLEPYRELLADSKYIIICIFIVIVFTLVSKILKRLLKRYFEKDGNLGLNDQTNYLFMINGINFIIFLLATILIFYTVPSLRALGLTLFASAGIFAAILGLAAQEAFSNIIGGIFIVIFKPFRVNDMVKVGSLNWGVVENITIRHTVLRSFENQRYIIPNSTMSSEIILNSSIEDPKTCIFLEMSIGYESDIDLAMKIMQEEAINHPDTIDNRTKDEIESGAEQVHTRLISINDSSLTIRAYVWTRDPQISFVVKGALLKSIKRRFDQEGIELPYPHRTIEYKHGKKVEN
ncbi:MAG: mechanosensitive ion channel family protein [Bacteroidetes bacterium]|nr:MAG: mechanosensitive ion channel family protein [Bacteroidota bacterium]MBL1145574.1 mechanosensitive ion channel family protein [Bacteroidota bacterium]NOG58370.1 mechanosensitive ion channel family protein [Bacteroidota bacterium]